MDFAGREAEALLDVCGLAKGHAEQGHPSNALQAVFDELIDCGLRGTRHRTMLCAKLLERVALKIADARAPLDGAETMAFSTYVQCQQHVQQHFRWLRTLEQIAAECHVNAAYLCRLFRRYGHESPYQYLLRLRMNFAADLLQAPGAMVKRVAGQSGFTDPFHFSRAFKSVFGLSPDAFRRLR